MIESLSEQTLEQLERLWELEKLCGRQQRTIERLEESLRKLEEQLRRNSGNFSQPPYMDGPEVARPKRRKKSKKRGGRNGHSGRSRPLLPPDEVDATVECKPISCVSCDHPLSGADPKPWRHRVSEIPEPRIEVTEYRRHRLKCEQCGHISIGELPDGVSQSAFGPRLHALTSLLTGRFLLSKRDAVTLYDVVYGLSMSPSSVIAMDRRVADAIAGPVNDALDWIRIAPVVHPDETSWQQAKQRAWLWTAATKSLAVFKIHPRRSQQAAKELLGEGFSGSICSDRYGAYNWIDRRGYCWAHLKRDFQAMAERFGSEWYGLRLVAAAKRVMRAWRHERDGVIDRGQRDSLLADERRRIHKLLISARERAPAMKTQRECAELLKTEDRMWTFVDIDEMDPTNNLAERCLRRGVLWRKKSFGTDSEAGSRFVERILSVVTSLQLQEREVFLYLVEAREAGVRGSRPPSLCPAT